jgi:hypothetical protein
MPDGLQHPEPTLQATALRYAAGDLTHAESAAFEARLGEDQEARDALSEAVRLSAAALGQGPPTPHRSFRAAIRERLSGWCPEWLARRAYRGHPMAWVGVGAAAVAACTLIGLSLANPAPLLDSDSLTGPSEVPFANVTVAQPGEETAPLAIAPAPREAESLAGYAPIHSTCSGGECGNSVAEIWAELSTPEHVEKAHDEELRWRLKMHNAALLHPGRPVLPGTADHPEP